MATGEMAHTFGSRVLSFLFLLLIAIAPQSDAVNQLVSMNSSASDTGTSDSTDLPPITADGRLVAFTSFSSNLVPNDTNGADDVFVRDLVAGTTTLVSINNTGTASGNDTSIAPIITPNGRFVVFVSGAGDLGANDTNG